MRRVQPRIGGKPHAGRRNRLADGFLGLTLALLLTGPGQRTLPRQMCSGINEKISITITAAGTLLVVLACLLLLAAEGLRRRTQRLRGGAE